MSDRLERKFYKFPRDFLYNSTKGVSIHFKKDRPHPVPDRCVQEIIGAGGVHCPGFNNEDYDVLLDQEAIEKALVIKKAQIAARERVKYRDAEIEKQAADVMKREAALQDGEDQKQDGTVGKVRFGDRVLAEVIKAEDREITVTPAKKTQKRKANSQTAAKRRASSRRKPVVKTAAKTEVTDGNNTSDPDK